MLHVISLAQFALAYTRGWAVNSQVARVRLPVRRYLRSRFYGFSGRLTMTRVAQEIAVRRGAYPSQHNDIKSSATCKSLLDGLG